MAQAAYADVGFEIAFLILDALFSPALLTCSNNCSLSVPLMRTTVGKSTSKSGRSKIRTEKNTAKLNESLYQRGEVQFLANTTTLLMTKTTTHLIFRVLWRENFMTTLILRWIRGGNQQTRYAQETYETIVPNSGI